MSLPSSGEALGSIELTGTQTRYLRAIHDLIRLNGYAPTIRELGDVLGVSSTNGVDTVLKILAAKGVIKRGGRGKARAMVLTLAARDVLAKGVA